VEYDRAIEVVQKLGGWNATGVRDDFLNSSVLQHGWKDGMRAKLCNACEELSRRCQTPRQKVIAIVIAGGAACDWERWHMTEVPNLDANGVGTAPGGGQEQHIRSRYHRLKLKVCTNAADVESFILRGMPLPECS